MRHVTVYDDDVIKTFADRHTQELYATGKSKRFPPAIAKRAVRKLEYIDLATRLGDLKVPPGNRLHELERDRMGNTRAPSTTNGVSASGSSTATPTMSRSRTTTEGEV